MRALTSFVSALLIAMTAIAGLHRQRRRVNGGKNETYHGSEPGIPAGTDEGGGARRVPGSSGCEEAELQLSRRRGNPGGRVMLIYGSESG
jgi:hypothetical protein